MKKFCIFLFFIILTTVQCFADVIRISKPAYDLYYKSHLEMEKQNYAQAINYIKKAIELAPNNYELTYKLGVYYISGPKQKPLSPLDAMEFIEKDPDISNAMNAFKKAIEIDPNRWEAYVAMARVYDGLDLTPQAVVFYNKGLAQPNATSEVKSYYGKIRDEAINRQQRKEAGLNKTTMQPDLYVPLDMNKWYIATYQGDTKYWFCEYGLKGESVVDYKWTKLVSIHFFSRNNFNFDKEQVHNYMLTLQKNTAEKVNDKVITSLILKDKENIYFEWGIPKLNEFEIARIFESPKGIYCVRYTVKQKGFTPDEKSSVVNLLKNFAVKH